MNLTQSRMARAALGWTWDTLAAESGVGRATIARFERGENVQPDRVQAMRRAFEDKGIQFLDGGKLAGGVVPPKEQV